MTAIQRDEAFDRLEDACCAEHDAMCEQRRLTLQALREQVAMTLAGDRGFAWVRLSVSDRRRWYEMADAVIPLVADHFVQAQRLADDTALDMDDDGSEFVRGWRSAQVYLRTQRLITEEATRGD